MRKPRYASPLSRDSGLRGPRVGERVKASGWLTGHHLVLKLRRRFYCSKWPMEEPCTQLQVTEEPVSAHQSAVLMEYLLWTEYKWGLFDSPDGGASGRGQVLS